MSFLTRLFGGPSVAGHERIRPDEYQARYVDGREQHTLVDVRTASEFSGEHLPGAVNISLQELPQKMTRIPTDRPVVIYCRTGNRSSSAARILLQADYADVYDLGGIIDWKRHGLPTV